MKKSSYVRNVAQLPTHSDAVIKTILCILVAVTTDAVTAAAAPRLLIDTVVADSDGSPGSNVIGKVHFTSENGVSKTAWIGAFEYRVTAALQYNGSIRLTETVTHHHDGGKDHIFGPYERSLDPGDTADLALGDIVFSTTVSAAN